MNPTRLRADAAGNRARIIAAARAAIADAGEVKLNAIARQAGVGQGTLYRHFPTREDLLAEVYREDVDELVAAAPALLAEHEPLTALACWFDQVAGYARIKRGVFAAVEAGVSQALAAHSLGPIGEAITVLLDAGKADGTIRPDVDARDVILLIGYLTRLDQSEWDTQPATCSRSSSTDCAARRGERREEVVAFLYGKPGNPRDRCDPDAAFLQLSRTAVEDHRVGKGRGLLGRSRLTSEGARHRATGEPQHFLNFFPLPQGRGALRPVLTVRVIFPGACRCARVRGGHLP